MTYTFVLLFLLILLHNFYCTASDELTRNRTLEIEITEPKNVVGIGSEFNVSNTEESNVNDLTLQEHDQRIPIRIAIVSGFIGESPSMIPKRPDAPVDCFYLTNNAELGKFATRNGWLVLLVTDVPLEDSLTSTEVAMANSANSKPLKVFVQQYLPTEYDFIIWIDPKYQLLTKGVFDTIMAWDPSVAVMMPMSGELSSSGADLEFTKQQQQSNTKC